MTLLKEMLENMVNKKEEDAKVNFHSYLTKKMQKITEEKSEEVQEQVQIPNEKVGEFMEEGRKLFNYAKFKVVKESDFYTNILISCHDESELRKAVDFADDFK